MCCLDYASLRGDIVPGISRAYLSMGLSAWRMKARGVLRPALWEMLQCWLEPECLILAVKVLHSMAQACLSSC